MKTKKFKKELWRKQIRAIVKEVGFTKVSSFKLSKKYYAKGISPVTALIRAYSGEGSTEPEEVSDESIDVEQNVKRSIWSSSEDYLCCGNSEPLRETLKDPSTRSFLKNSRDEVISPISEWEKEDLQKLDNLKKRVKRYSELYSILEEV